VETSGLAGHELGFAQRARYNCAALVGDNQLDRQVARVASPHGAELLLGPAHERLHKPRGERL
jgi:hypothetical protein